MQERLVTVQIARHVLWHFGDTNLGVPPGSFVERLLLTISAADLENLARLELAFPGYVVAFRAVARESWGLDWLRKKVKAFALRIGTDSTDKILGAAAQRCENC